MEELAQELRRLVEQACAHPPGSAARQKSLTRIIRLINRRLWRSNVPGYEDALQQTWLFFCRNICEATTGQKFDPDRATVITWLNNYLTRRLQDTEIERQKSARIFISPIQFSDGQPPIDKIDTITAPDDIPPILEEIRAWAESDPDGDLRGTHIKGKPEINCQFLILHRLPPETSWEDLAAEVDSKVSTLSAFYQRQCMPRLRKFGQSEGYV